MIELGGKAYLLFDGDCGICSWSADFARTVDRRRKFVIQPYQTYPETTLQMFGVSYAECDKKLHVIAPSGRVYRGAFAVNYFGWHYFPWSVLVFLVYALPVLLLFEIIGYAWVARNRQRLSQWFGLKACLLRR